MCDFRSWKMTVLKKKSCVRSISKIEGWKLGFGSAFGWVKVYLSGRVVSMEYMDRNHTETEELPTQSIIREKYELRDNCKRIFKMLVSRKKGSWLWLVSGLVVLGFFFNKLEMNEDFCFTSIITL